jgi:hypothetical protein
MSFITNYCKCAICKFLFCYESVLQLVYYFVPFMCIVGMVLFCFAKSVARQVEAMTNLCKQMPIDASINKSVWVYTL